VGAVGKLGIALVCAGACAAPASAQRRLDLGVSATILYDSNVARSSRAQAAQRGLVREDVRFTPAATLDLLVPVGRHELFAEGLAGYDFYARNERLDRERIEARSGLGLRFAQCRSDIFGAIASRQTELDDITLGPVQNRETVKSINFEGRCGRPAGFSPRLNVRYESGRNSRLQRRTSNIDSFEMEGALGYRTVSLGEIALFGRYQDARFPERRRPIEGTLRRDGFEAYTLGLSYDRQIGTALRGTIAAGYTEVRPDLPDLPRFDGLTYSAILLLNPLGRLKGRIEGAREVDASNRLDVSYFVEDRLRARADYDISPRARAELGAGYRDRDFKAAPGGLPIRGEETTSLFTALQVQATPKIRVRLELEQEKRDTDNPIFNYQSTQVALSTSITF
jgi:hypothetical protein